MANELSASEAALRRVFRYGNKGMLLLWRLGLGPSVSIWPPVTGRIMVLGHTGRRSGQRRLTPLNYAIVAGDVYLTAGFGPVSDWYKNIKAMPAVELWLPDGRWYGTADELPDDDPRRLELLRAVLRGSGIVAPLSGVDPERLGDAELTAATTKYRLVRVRRAGRRSGPSGPGDLAWIWALLSAVAVAWLYRRWLRPAKHT
jgi:deazaflavin-dependent oxidoreductase (nitroreductase family)